MQTTEIIGIVVIGLGAVLGLFMYFVNLASKYITEPYQKLTTAIEKLNLSITVLNANDENTKIILAEHKVMLKDHDRMLYDIYDKIADIQYNCSYLHQIPIKKFPKE